MEFDFFERMNTAVTVCDTKGVILYMNEKSGKTFAKYGGKELIGKNLEVCHPGHATDKVNEMMRNGTSNSYTIEKHGIKKLIHQTPWYLENGDIGGLVEFSIELPAEMSHFVRS
jgi:PAS domain S-box-containing protein